MAISIPAAPPRNVYDEPLEDERPGDPAAPCAPSAIFTPISLVRSLTTAYMMFATPTPPMMSVSAPMMPRKSWIPMQIVLAHLLRSTVFQTSEARARRRDRTRSFAAEDLARSARSRPSSGRRRVTPDDEVVDRSVGRTAP